MAFVQDCGSGQSCVALRTSDRLTLGLIAMGVIFASLGLGEAVYRFAFFDFEDSRRMARRSCPVRRSLFCARLRLAASTEIVIL